MRRLSRRAPASPVSSEAPPSPPVWPFLRFILFLLLLGLIAGWNLLAYAWTGMDGLGLRYLVIPAIILFFMLRSAGKFSQGLYDFRHFGSGFQRLMSLMFGISYPMATISDGKLYTRLDDDNLIATAGGPGYVMVLPDSAALVESSSGQARVLRPGRPYLTRWESLKEAFNLEERIAKVDKIAATSKDGIEMWARDVRYRYRLLHDPAEELGGPQRFSEQAVIDAVYIRNITGAGLATWHSAVHTAIEGVIQDYIRKNTVDQLTAPRQEGEDPRGSIYKRLNGDEGRNLLMGRGAELLWIDIGHFESAKEKVAEQRIDTWQALWKGKADEVRASGEGRVDAYREIGRAEGQVEVLQNLIRVLEETANEGDVEQNRQALYLARIAQLLEGRSRQLSLPEGEK